MGPVIVRVDCKIWNIEIIIELLVQFLMCLLYNTFFGKTLMNKVVFCTVYCMYQCLGFT